MKNLFILLVIVLFFSACTLKKVSNKHGIPFLEKKQSKLIVKKSNKNDILSILGPPSTKSDFGDDIWIYVERTKTKGRILSFGSEKILKNNVLILEINEKGILQEKIFKDLNHMNKLTFNKYSTNNMNKKNTFVYDFLTSLRHKINDPLGKRRSVNQQ
jgi:outer membrane protein assembly factor BamE (lipoprotein component of BamABCDE complex)|tara:strand:- start:977 stop:1450 length:474 start_codon:yes stop_codon:yes gene_type:complete